MRLTWILGVLVPVAGLLVAFLMLDAFDPFRVFIYSYSSILLVSLSTWLLGHGQFGRAIPLFQGSFYGGALFAVGFGVVLFPFTVLALALGLFSPIFLLFAGFGFAPFAWMLMLGIQGRQAGLRGSRNSSRRAFWFCGFVAPFLLAAFLQILAHRIESNLKDEIASASGAELDAALDHLSRWHLVVDTDLLFAEHRRRHSPDPEGAQHIARAYKQFTGDSLEDSPVDPGPIEFEMQVLTGRPPARSGMRSAD